MKILGVYNGKVASVTYFDGKKLFFQQAKRDLIELKIQGDIPIKQLIIY